MSARSVATKLLAAIVIMVAVIAILSFLIGIGVFPREFAPPIIYSLVVLFFGIWLITTLAGFTVRTLRPKLSHRVYTLRNVILVVGYVTIAIVILLLFGVPPDVALAGGTFGGLIIGLGAQPILGNFFAGILILATGFFKVGDEVRLVTASLPFFPVQFPAYKYFSADYINYGYKGKVVDVGLFYATVTTDTGLEFRVPNQIVFNSAVVDYRPSHSLERLLQVRYEFKIEFDPDEVLRAVGDALSDLKQVQKILINEQSDKEYYIILIQFSAPISEDWAALKSEILKRVVKVHRELRNKS
ncbi:MAG: mechanosensitive ion channel family protein [Nitrososphaerales archaeon]